MNFVYLGPWNANAQALTQVLRAVNPLTTGENAVAFLPRRFEVQRALYGDPD